LFKNDNNLTGEKKGIRLTYEGELPFFAWVCKALTQRGYTYSLCGGRYGAKCGKCKVRFQKNAPLPTAIERKMLKADELRDGIRLACQTSVKEGTEVEALFGNKPDIMVETLVEHDDFMPEKNVIGVDLGTSTIVAGLWNPLEKKIKTVKRYNPQIKYGADVISRIDASVRNGKDVIAKEIRDTLFSMIDELCENENCNKDTPIYISGNTVMLHLLAGEDPNGLGYEPFKPVFLCEKRIEEDDRSIILLPGISAFVGADILAGLISVGMLPTSDKDNKRLFIDLGTNAELVICDGYKLIASATAAGSAFALDKGEGSHVIHLLAEELRNKRVDNTGLLLDDSGNLTQKDIRELQLAKAAIRTGIETLLKKSDMKYSDVDKIYIAGGFGYYLEASDAIDIGLLPEFCKDRIVVIGNASLLGSIMYDKIKSSVSEEISKCQAINLALEDGFGDEYIKQVNFDGFI